MPLGDYNHYRHGHHPATWGGASQAVKSRTLMALPEAIAQVEDAVHCGKLITPFEAMALAGREAREKETLYSIALKISQKADLDLDVLLSALSQRFSGYT